jgi:glycosyltransferase involved in cell wall biosynthesis
MRSEPLPLGLPLVSVVTPVLNGRRFLPDLLESIRAQDYPRIEHIVVDGGSTDGTLDLLASTPNMRWVTAADRGMYDAINRGFRLAGGDVLAYQNADDRYVPGAISTAVRHLVAHPELDAVYGDFRYVDEQGRPLGSGVSRSRPFDRSRLRHCNCIPPHSLFVRARIVRGQGHWLDPHLQFAGDWEWVLAMAMAGRRFAYLPATLSEFRLHGRSKTATTGLRRRVEEWRRICRRHRVSLPALLWYEGIYAPLRRRLGLPV